MPRALPRALLVISTALSGGFVSAQVDDAFTDGDYTALPAWSGTTALFVVVDDGGDQRLRSNSPGAANYHLSTPNSLVNDTRWEFFFDLRFNPSGANYVDAYLMSNAGDLASGVSGYVLRIGGTADRLELFRSDAGTLTSLGVQSPDGGLNSSSNPFRVRIDRTAAALFTLSFDDGNTGSFVLAGSVTDATYASATHFGLRIEQSTAASAVNNHFFDDFSVGPIPVDLTPPALVSAIILSDTQIDLVFSEAVEQTTAEEENNYAIIPFNSAASVVLDGVDPTLVHLTLSLPMQSGNTYTITINGVEDQAGNPCVNESEDVLYFVPDEAEAGDVIINELMADPSLPVGLPEVEYVELFNATASKTFDLAGWTYSDGGDDLTLPMATLAPGAHILITSASNVSALSPFGPVIAPSGSVSLTNTGDPIVIREPGGVTVDEVTYSDDWYNDEAKAEGGWSLERIDPGTPCSSAANWTASNDPQGGTPGGQNSVFAIVPDVTPPALVGVLVNSDVQIQMVFNEAMDAVSLGNGTYLFDPALSIAQVTVVDVFQVQVSFSSPMTVGQIYTVTITGVTDCPGNLIADSNTGTFALPEPALPGDVVINEVLYDPLESGSDFVELYNRSNKVLSLANWKLANESGGVIGSPLPITTASHLLLPGEYIAICESAANIASTYPQGHADRYLVTDMPSYNNGEGVVVLQDPLGDTLDRFAYDDDLHFLLLNSTDGVSLERVSPERPATDDTNWQSAAEPVGYATPGYQNSQYSPNTVIAGEMTIERRIFSPDNDGHEDVLTIAYHFEAPGFTGTLKIFDVAGREVRTLMNNELLGTLGAVSWDGIMEEGDLARMGPYVVMLEAFDLDGNVERFKETVVLAHKLD